jgi:hypothetical protein
MVTLFSVVTVGVWAAFGPTVAGIAAFYCALVFLLTEIVARW